MEHYRRLCRILDRELGTAPSREAQELDAAIS
ncbi:hypothetical protein [Actinoplanes sp. NPDC051411]